MPDEIASQVERLLEGYERQTRHATRAAAAILPGPLLAAFAPGIRPGGLRPPCLGDFALLADWGHPLADFVEQWLADENPAAPELTPPQRERVTILFRIPWRHAAEEVATSGLANFSGCSPELLLTSEALCRHLLGAFLTRVPLQWPTAPGAIAVGTVRECMGWWLRLLTFAVTECHLAPEAALGVPVAQLVALRSCADVMAGAKAPQGGYVQAEEAVLKALEVPHA